MSHCCYVSEWFLRDKDYEEFKALLHPGDLIEFDRGIYRHWGVYIGFGKVVHRANPQETGMSSVSSKGKYGIGGIGVETLSDIWRDSHARINNSYDKLQVPHSPQDIVKRAREAVDDCSIQKLLGEYNVLTKNCEHFATWARNGVEDSIQANRAVVGAAAAGVGVVVGIAAIAGFIGSRRENSKSLEHKERPM